MPNKSFVVNYLGARAAAVGIWQRAIPFRGCSERAGWLCLLAGASAGSPEHAEEGEPRRGCGAGRPPLPWVEAVREGGSKAPKIRASLTSPGGGER